MLSKPLASPEAGNVVYSGTPLAPMSAQPAYCSGAPKMPKMLSSAISSSALTWVLPTSSSSTRLITSLPPVHAAEAVLVVEVRLHAALEAFEEAVAERVRRAGAEHGEVDRFVGHTWDARRPARTCRCSARSLPVRCRRARCPRWCPPSCRRARSLPSSPPVRRRRWLPPWSPRSAQPSCRTIRRRRPSCRTRREPGHPRPIRRTNGVSLSSPRRALRSIKIPLVERSAPPFGTEPWPRTLLSPYEKKGSRPRSLLHINVGLKGNFDVGVGFWDARRQVTFSRSSSTWAVPIPSSEDRSIPRAAQDPKPSRRCHR